MAALASDVRGLETATRRGQESLDGAVAALRAEAEEAHAALESGARIAVDETVILLHSPLPLVGILIEMERG